MCEKKEKDKEKERKKVCVCVFVYVIYKYSPIRRSITNNRARVAQTTTVPLVEDKTYCTEKLIKGRSSSGGKKKGGSLDQIV